MSVKFGGQDYLLPDGANLAVALLMVGIEAFNQTVSRGVGRAPFCLMGTCFDCLVEVDGETSQACLMQVKEGLDIQPARQMREGPYAAR
ncbi:2Fe-2S iron-sulfur cluster-binding protein [Shimia sp.]|uniref:2Fe-2S iron-sulfur cluster-binding protein n=1 Tax=Shimia sp. TaxID=1954381 RepID=UPI003296A8BE